MYWLVKINFKELEIWTDTKYSMMMKKCEYYGAKPFWQTIRKLEFQVSNNYKNYCWEPGEIVPYFETENAQRFAMITELLNYKGILSFKGFDVSSRVPLLLPIPN